MRIVFVNGRELTLSWHELRGLLWHPWFVALMLGVSVVIILLRPYDDLVALNAMQKTLFYANGVVSFMGLLVGCLYLARGRAQRVLVSLALTVSVIGATIWGLWFGVLLGAHPPRMYDYVLVSAFNLTFALLGEIVFASFLLGRILRDIGHGAPAPGPQPAAVPPTPNATSDPTVDVLGRRFLASDLWMMAAEEHYVSIATTGGKTVLLRGNMSNAVAGLPPSLGMQVHRSHWVARRAVATLIRTSKGWHLALANGVSVPVARSRQAAVALWLDQPMKKAPERVPFAKQP